MSADAVSVEFLAAGRAEGEERFVARAASAAELPPRVVGSRGTPHELQPACVSAAGGLRGCVACGHPELYLQKDVPRALGIAVVVVAALLAPKTRYLSLVVAALIDLVLFYVAPNMLVCYVCDARHRGFANEPRHPRFDREIDERLKYGDRAVMGKPMREGGTAGAPDPEH